MTQVALKLSRRLERFPLVYALLRRLYCLYRPGVRFRVERAFQRFEKVRVVKIGANDGITSDPFGDFFLRDSRYSGVFVEPIPEYATALSDNFSSTGRFVIEQAAIGESDRECPFFMVDLESASEAGFKLEPWVKGVASFDRSHVESHLPSDARRFIIEVKVPVLCVATLLVRHEISEFDLLHIDAEGYDYAILKQFDLRELGVSVVLCEKKHLSDEETSLARQLLTRGGFRVFEDDTDFLGLR